jgi:hypothetical protein
MHLMPFISLCMSLSIFTCTKCPLSASACRCPFSRAPNALYQPLHVTVHFHMHQMPFISHCMSLSIFTCTKCPLSATACHCPFSRAPNALYQPLHVTVHFHVHQMPFISHCMSLSIVLYSAPNNPAVGGKLQNQYNR